MKLLQKQIGHVQYLLAESPYAASIVACDMPAGEVIDYVRKFDFVEYHAHPLGDMIRAGEHQAALLAYFRNNVLHLLALPAMQAANWGRIINVASVHGLVGSAQKSAYVAAKHGIVGLTKVTALENAASGVTCNAICPGWVLTPLVQKQVDAKAAERGITNEEAKRLLLGEKEPSMQFTTPEELGELAVFFCSPAANNVRGVAWNMDGGWTAQ